MIFDSHMHTEFSFDSEMKAADAIERAKQLGIGLVFTEHLDYGLPGQGDWTFSPEEYMKTYGSLRGDSLRLGVEVGMTKKAREINKEFIDKAPFDMVIGSIHVVEDMDIYYPEFYKDKSKEEAYRAYFAVMAEEAALMDMDVLGHIDYMARYAPYPEPKMDYEMFHEEIDKVLHIVLDRGIVMELNSRRLGDTKALNELTPIYRRYHELGGKYVTIGSDAHGADAVGTNFKAALDFCKSLGLEVVTFSERKLQTLTP